MHDVYDKMSVSDLAELMTNTEFGLEGIKANLNETEVGNYYDTFIEETCELLSYLFIHFKRD